MSKAKRISVKIPPNSDRNVRVFDEGGNESIGYYSHPTWYIDGHVIPFEWAEIKGYNKSNIVKEQNKSVVKARDKVVKYLRINPIFGNTSTAQKMYDSSKPFTEHDKARILKCLKPVEEAIKDFKGKLK